MKLHALGGPMPVTPTYDPRKFRELLIYLAEQSRDDPRFGAVKLNKLMYYCDFIAYWRLGQPITGATYQKLSEGPAPRELLSERAGLLDRGEINLETAPYFTYVQQRVAPAPDRTADISVFNQDELAIIHEVLQELRGLNGREVSERSHGEPGWLLSNDGEDIPYFTAWLSSEPLTAEEEEFGREVAQQLGLERG
ncbi:MAG: Panacea domain-containing protein [Chloroflexota bacterium]